MKSVQANFFLLLFLISTSNLLWSQTQLIQGNVKDRNTGEVLPFANITYGKHAGGTSADINGNFSLEIPTGITSIECTYVGYEKLIVDVKTWEGRKTLYLSPIATSLSTIDILAGENPALRIIRNAYNNRKSNDPEQLKSFSYRAYNKFIITAAEIERSPDSEPPTDTIVSDPSFEAFLEKSHLLAMESVSERFFRYPRSSEERILATRVSGLQDPQFAFLATEVQSFSMYSDFMRIMGVDYLNPISKAGMKQYFYELKDTTYAGLDTVFIIAFRPKSKADITRLMKGVLYINTSGWAVQNTIAQAATDADLEVKIHQLYTPVNGFWFPMSLNYEFNFNNLLLGDNKIMKGIGRYQLSDIEIEPDLSKKRFSGLDIIIDPMATRNTELIYAYRDSSNLEKLNETYRFIDSVSTQYSIERRMRALSQISEARINYKYLSFDLNRLLRFNGAENTRLGLGLYTSDQLSRKWSIGGWFGYGFRDRTWKYGASTIWRPNPKTSIEVGYERELYETGGTPWMANRGFSLNNTDVRRFFVFQMDEVRQYFGTLSYQIRPKLEMRLSTQIQNRIMRGDFLFDPHESGLEPFGQFDANILGLQLDYTPKTRFIQTAYKRLALEQRMPHHQISIKRGFQWLNANQIFTRLDWRSQWSFKAIAGNTTDIAIQAGYVDRAVPASFLFYGSSNQRQANSFWRSLSIADRLSFETLFFNEMLMDAHASIIVHQEIIRSLYKAGRSNPSVELAFKALWGQLQDPSRHLNQDVTAPSSGFYEAGILINRLYRSSGLGVYSRLGAYRFDRWQDNIALRLTFKLG